MNRIERKPDSPSPLAPATRFARWPMAALVRLTLLVALALTASGCGSFVARRMAQSPNTYPRWLTPPVRVELAFDSNFLTNFPPHYVKVGPPTARLHYRIIEPADYNFTTIRTNWMKRGQPHYKFSFGFKVTGPPNEWTAQPRGTVLLLHGYGMAQFAMAPWALRLAQDGWRCVLVDLRGHGKSTGRRIYYGIHETRDLSQLLDQLASEDPLAGPVAALGDSFGGTLSLRLKASDPRIERAVAIAPYAALSNVVVNIHHEYANWLPGWFPRLGLKHLPALLKVPPEELDTASALARQPVTALFVAGGGDKISPEAEVQKLYALAMAGSELLVVPKASHESLPYYFHELALPVLAWLSDERLPRASAPLSAREDHRPAEATAPQTGELRQ